MTTRYRRILTSVAALGAVCIIAVTGCASSPQYSSQTADFSYEPDRGVLQATGGSALSAAEDSQTRSTTGSNPIDVEEQIIVTGTLRMVVDDPQGASTRISELVKDSGGRITTQSLSTRGTLPEASLTARIPAASFDETLTQIQELGDVKSVMTTAEDVGAQVADLDARIAALEASIARLTELMSSATSTFDLLEAERELTNRQADLDSLNSQRAWYSDRVALSTLDIQLSSPSIEAAPSRSVWARSWESFVDGMSVIAYALIMLAPWLIVIIPLIALLTWWRRRRRARRALRVASGDNGKRRWWHRAAPAAVTVSDGARAPAESPVVGVDTTVIEDESTPTGEESDHE